MTRSMTLDRTHGDTAQQLSILTDQTSRLDAKLSKITTATVERRDNSSTGKRQVSFDNRRDKSQSPARLDLNKRPTTPTFESGGVRERQRINRCDQPKRDYSCERLQKADSRPTRFDRQRPVNVYHPMTGSPNGVMHNDNYGSPQWQQQQQAACFRCGTTQAHSNPIYCPMIDKNCFTCGKPGHSSRLCRSAQNTFSRFSNSVELVPILPDINGSQKSKTLLSEHVVVL